MVLYTDRRTHGRKAEPGSRRRATGGAAIRGHTLPLLDTLPPWHPRRSVRNSMPRISVPGYTQPSPIPPPPAPDDPVDGTRLALRLQALERALDDLPGHARRFARWRHRAAARARYQDAAARARGKVSRTITHVIKPDARPVRCWPLRMGRPPGWHRKGGHEVHDVVLRTNGLALHALEGRDTS